MSAHSNATGGDSDVIKSVIGRLKPKTMAALTSYLFSTPAVTILPQDASQPASARKKSGFFLIFLNFFFVFFVFFGF
jgi:hypothetical protein